MFRVDKEASTFKGYRGRNPITVELNDAGGISHVGKHAEEQQEERSGDDYHYVQRNLA